MEQDIVVQGNPRVYKALKTELEKVLVELKRIEKATEKHDELLQLIEIITVTLYGLKGENAND